MQKVIVIVDGTPNFYNLIPPITAEEVAASCGVTDPSLYQEFDGSDFDPASYFYTSAFSLSAGVVSFDLAAAKVTASNQVKYQTATEQQAALAGYTPEVLASQAILPELSRTPEIQVVLEDVNDLNTTLQANLTAIAAATTIDEINNIVNPPTGIIGIGRGYGVSPLDLNNSFYSQFNSVSLTQADTELYVPGTSTVIPYNSVLGGFDSIGDCFAFGNYLIQIRETATSMVIAEFECPLGANQDIYF